MKPGEVDGLFGTLRRIEDKLDETRDLVVEANLPQLVRRVDKLRIDGARRAGARDLLTRWPTWLVAIIGGVAAAAAGPALHALHFG